MARFILEVELVPGVTFARLRDMLRDEGDKLLKHPMPREYPAAGDYGAAYGPDGKVEVQFGGPGGLISIPRVRYGSLREVEGAAERLFAAAAMSWEPLKVGAIDAHFEALGMEWVKTVTLAGEYIALPHPEYTGRWCMCEGWHGMFVYTESIVRIAH